MTTTTGCFERSAVPPPDTPSPFPELGIAASNYPKVDGSTSAEPLQILFACKVLGAHYMWTHDESDDSRRLIAADLFELIEEYDTYEREKEPLCRFINSVAKHRGTHKAYVNLIEERADLILVARRPSDDELRLASTKGVEFDIVDVALDAFVFLLNDANPVDSLTGEQVRAIYSGEVRNWNQVGGDDLRINPYQRNRNSGSQEVMRRQVMKGHRLSTAPELLTGSLMGYPYLAVDRDSAGIGYSFYFYQEYMAPRPVKACAIDGIRPSPATVSSREYPFVTEVLAVLRSDCSATHPARKLRDWMLSSAGQQMVQECGYVSVDTGIAEGYDRTPRGRFGPTPPDPTRRSTAQ